MDRILHKQYLNLKTFCFSLLGNRLFLTVALTPSLTLSFISFSFFFFFVGGGNGGVTFNGGGVTFYDSGNAQESHFTANTQQPVIRPCMLIVIPFPQRFS